MTHLIGDFVERVEYNSYEDFKKNFKIKIPENFNFAFDVVDKYAEIDENKMALVWTNDEESHSFTFSELKKLSNQTANFFKSLGIKKEDKVILTLKNRYEFWISMVALHKIGAIAIPATHMLKRHDIHYRITNAEIKAVISVNVLRQKVKLLVENGDEKEIKEYNASELKFKKNGHKDKEILSEEEQKALEILEKQEREDILEKQNEQEEERRENHNSSERKDNDRKRFDKKKDNRNFENRQGKKDKKDWQEKSDRNEKSDKNERREKPERNERHDKSDKQDRHDKKNFHKNRKDGNHPHNNHREGRPKQNGEQ